MGLEFIFEYLSIISAIFTLSLALFVLRKKIKQLFGSVCLKFLDKLLLRDATTYTQSRQEPVGGRFDHEELEEIVNSMVTEFNKLYKFVGIDIIFKDCQCNDFNLVYSTIAKKTCQLKVLGKLSSCFYSMDELVLSELKATSGNALHHQICNIMQLHNYDIAMPIRDGQHIVGIIFATKPCRVLKKEDYKLLRQVIRRVSLALCSVILYQQTLQNIKHSSIVRERI